MSTITKSPMTKSPAGFNDSPNTSSNPNTRSSLWAGLNAMGGTLVRPSGLRDSSNVFEEKSLEDIGLHLFTHDVLMEGVLKKRNPDQLSRFIQRMFVLRGQELSYYTLDTTSSNSEIKCGALKGKFDLSPTTQLERMDNNSFSIQTDDCTRVLQAESVRDMIDWMTAIRIAANATCVPPTSASMYVNTSKTTHIILVRHGEYLMAHNGQPSKDLDEDMSMPLTRLGQTQAEATGEYIAKYLRRVDFNDEPVVYHSGVRRTQQTAAYIQQKLSSGDEKWGLPETAPSVVQQDGQVVECKLLREAWPCPPLPSTNQQKLPKQRLAYMASDHARMKVVERSLLKFQTPMDYSNGDEAAEKRKVNVRVVVTHANVIKYLACKGMGASDPSGMWGKLSVANSSITILQTDALGNWSLKCLNETGHLPEGCVTGS